MASTSTPEPAPRTPAAVALSGVDVLAIGISTGGPNALRQVIPRLPGNLGVPVLIVQHMPPSFTKALAESLDRESELTVKEAEDGETLQPGVAYIAPGGQHLAVRLDKNPAGDRVAVVINQDPPVNSCRPSVDVLLKSLPPVYGGRVLVAIMTGMGNDGAAGVAQIKAKGGYCLTQTEETCVVYGMPRAVDEAGLSDEKAPLDQIAARLIALARSSAERKPPA